jgi:hypothetical protein|nr:MAG TPA: hypothetical protein [Caudoviricetes sp.]
MTKIINGIDATGQLFINDQDAWLTWGAYLVGESEDNLLLPASSKPYTKNDFRSQAGQQIFIANPKDESRDVQIELCIISSSRSEYLTAYKNLVKELKSGLVVMYVPLLDEAYNLTEPSFLNLGYYEWYGKLSVRFNEYYSVPVIFEILATEAENPIITEDGEIILI